MSSLDQSAEVALGPEDQHTSLLSVTMIAKTTVTLQAL